MPISPNILAFLEPVVYLVLRALQSPVHNPAERVRAFIKNDEPSGLLSPTLFCVQLRRVFGAPLQRRNQ